MTRVHWSIIPMSVLCLGSIYRVGALPLVAVDKWTQGVLDAGHQNSGGQMRPVGTQVAEALTTIHFTPHP